MNEVKKIAIQGYEGSFHEEAARQYFAGQSIEVVPCSSFDALAQLVESDEVDEGIMAIENSIAGSILQNYRLLRQHSCYINGEIFLRIQHQLMALPGVKLADINEVRSHPMAINQCLTFLNKLDGVKCIEAEDTALSAKDLTLSQNRHQAAIASQGAASIYGLDIIAPNIETHQQNYTRFLIIGKEDLIREDADKASIYLSIPDKKGHLLRFLQLVDDCNMNMSKLQSYPKMGEWRAYFFHIDLEFNRLEDYHKLLKKASEAGYIVEELGLYVRANMDFLNTPL